MLMDLPRIKSSCKTIKIYDKKKIKIQCVLKSEKLYPKIRDLHKFIPIL